MTGDNGILEQAANAKEATDEASELESVTLAVNGAIMASDSFIVEESLLNSELANYFEAGSYSVSGDADSGYTVTIGVKRYAVTSLGSITKIGDAWYEDDTDTEYYINSALQLCELADIVNNGEDTFENKTVYLTSDIDMNEAYDAGYTFDPIGTPNFYFEGTFDGNGFTISNMDNPVYSEGSYTNSGMFMNLYGDVENLTIADSTFNANYAGAVTGSFIVGGNVKKTSIINCYSINNTIIGTNYARWYCWRS